MKAQIASIFGRVTSRTFFEGVRDDRELLHRRGGRVAAGVRGANGEAEHRIPARGVLNLHSGILPDYRGVMATFWAMLHDEAEIGTTLHRIVDAGIDTGPVLAITRRRADYGATYLANVLALYADGVLELGRAIGAIERGEETGGAGQSASEGAYFGPPGAADVEKFLAKGLKLADSAEGGALQVP